MGDQSIRGRDLDSPPRLGTRRIGRRELLRLGFGTTAILLAGACQSAPSAAPTTVPAAAPTAVSKTAAAAPTAAPAQAGAAAPAAAAKPADAKPAGAKPAEKPGEQPIRGGSLGYAWWVKNRHYDFHKEPGSSTLHVEPAYSGLVALADSGRDKIVPDLAERWDYQDGGKSLVFQIRSGVKWHDGHPLTAEDLAWVYDRYRRAPPGEVAPFVPLEMVESVTASGNNVVFRLKYPSLDILEILATGYLRALPRHILEKKGHMEDMVVGTGPFMFKEHTRGVSMRFVRNPDYFRPGLPYLDEFIVHEMEDPATAWAALQTGQLQITTESLAPLDRIPEVERNPGLRWVQDGLVQSLVIRMQPKGPFADYRVRKAVHLAVDRQAAQKVLGGGIASIPFLLPEKSRFSLKSSEYSNQPGWRTPKDQDIAEAKKLLAEAGHPNGFEIEGMIRKGGDFQAVGEFVQADLQKIGINLKANLVDRPEWAERYFTPGPKSGDYFIHPVTFTMYYDGVDQFVGASLGAGSIKNYGLYPKVAQEQARFQELVQQALNAQEKDAQAQIIRNFQQYLMTDESQLWVIPILERIRPMFFSKRVRGHDNPGGANFSNSFAEVWLAQA